MHSDTKSYNDAQSESDRAICQVLAEQIDLGLPEAENKIWHRHPVWFLDGNPVVGYSKLKGCVRLLFWSGQSFEESGLISEGSFKAAEARYTSAEQVDTRDLQRWLGKARSIQWDYKNIVRRKGRLERLSMNAESVDNRVGDGVLGGSLAGSRQDAKTQRPPTPRLGRI